MNTNTIKNINTNANTLFPKNTNTNTNNDIKHIDKQF